MDGVSSALAVVGFTIQLVGVVNKARKFLKEVRNAPEELNNLVDTLDEFEGLLVVIKNLVEQQNAIGNLSGAVCHTASVLQSCERTVANLNDAVDTINKYFESHHRGRKIWASMKTVVKRDQIKNIHEQIQKDMMRLQTALMLNLSHLQLHQLRLLPSQQNSVSDASNFAIEPKRGHPRVSPGNSVVQTRTADTWLYCGFIGRVKHRKQTKGIGTRGNSPEITISEENRLTYAPSFLQMALELQYDTGFSVISRSLHCFQVLSSGFMYDMCHHGDVDRFTQALSRREFSPFARTRYGSTWLHLAAQLQNLELCRLLLQINVDASHIDDLGWKALHYASMTRRDSQLDTVRVLATGQDDIAADELPSIFNDMFQGSPECADLLMSTYNYSDESFHAGIQDNFLFKVACREYGSGTTGWANSIQKWLRRKPNPHARSFVSEDNVGGRFRVLQSRSLALRQHQEMTFTLLDELFFLSRDPFQSKYLGQEWLLMLEEAGYDVNTYLEKEKQLHLNQDFRSYPLSSSLSPGSTDGNIWRQLVFDIGENPKVHWHWWIDPSSHASLVAHEYRYLNPDHIVWGVGSYFESKAWKETWPFDYPHWTDNFRPPFHDTEEDYRWQNYANQAARRHKRQAKKKYPEMFEDITDGIVIPGAWVEDDF